MRTASTRAGVALAVAAALAAQTVGLAVPAHAASSVADTIATVGTAPYELNSQALKQRLATALDPALVTAPGPVRLDAVAETAGWYVDGARFDQDADGRQAYLHDLHLVSHLDSSLRGNQTAATEQLLTQGMVDVLMAGRTTAEIAVADARTVLRAPEAPASGATVDPASEEQLTGELATGGDPLGAVDPVVDPLGRAAAERDLAAAERSLDKAHDALAKGLPVAAETHLGHAWQQAVNVLGHLGVTYDGDRDADGIPDRAELAVGGSPLLRDTDGDGLRDVVEFDAMAVVSLGDPDTDGDGVGDAQEDHDGDGLVAADEQALGSSLVDADTDADGLRDGDERSRGTKVLERDTDGDGLLDGGEPRAGLDGTLPDTDGDGVLDGDELLTVTVDGPAGASARVTGTGESALDVRISEVTGDVRGDAPAQHGPTMEFESPGDGLVQAEISLPFERGALTDDQVAERMRVFWLDESVNAWVPAAANQSVNAATGRVTVTVDHFSRYAVFDIVNWNQTWTAKDNPCRSRNGGGDDVVFLDLALSIDSSGSMSWNDPQGLRRQAAKNFVDALLDQDRSAVVDFDSWARVLQSLTTDKAAVKAAIDRVDDSGGTNIGAGVGVANSVLANNGDPDRGRVMILLTDGDGSWNDSHLATAKANSITIYTIGLGSGVNTSLLGRIASETGGQYHQVATADQLPDVFRRIGENTGGDEGTNRDSDDDGLNDCVEIEGAYSPANQQRYTSDPDDADTDDDGLEDGEEVLPFPRERGIPAATDVFWVQSNPALADSDSDGLVDPLELETPSSAWLPDSDSDGLSDDSELEWGTGPYDSDSDGDGFTDGYEVGDPAAGFQPLVFDDPMTADEWASEFAKGAALGDAGDGDTIPFLLGTIASSGVSTIPVVGWLAGLVLDLRDAIANTVKGEWAAAGMSVAGFVPYVGDAANIAAKVMRFLSRNATMVDDVIAAIAKLEDIPASVRADVLRRVNGAFEQLRSAGVSDDVVLRLAGSRHGVSHVTDAMRRVGATVGPRIDFVSGWRAAEDAVAGSVGAVHRGRYQRIPGHMFGRYVDVVDVNGHAHEVKSGFVKLQSSITRQIQKDAEMLADPNNDVEAVVWHFVASGRSSSLGADPRVLDLLDENGISYVIHLP